jgi:hypothetical protein
MQACLVALFVCTPAFAIRIMPSAGGWSTAMEVVAGSELQAYTLPLSFDPANSTAGVTVYDAGRFVRLAVDGNNAVSAAPLITNAHRWSYCAGELLAARMRRHCYTGGPVLTGLTCDQSGGCSNANFRIDWHSPAHQAPPGPVMNANGVELIADGARGEYALGDQMVISMRATPSLRLDVVNGIGSLWTAHNVADTSGSMILCMVVVASLVTLTRVRHHGCEWCGDGFTTSADVALHMRLAHSGKPTPRPGESQPARSHVYTNSGIDGALRIIAGVSATIIWAFAVQDEAAFVAERELGDAGLILVYVAGTVVIVGCCAGRIRLKSPHWAYTVFLACEVLLLVTLAYMLPRSYGESVTVATLFVAGVVSAVLVGRACSNLFVLGTTNVLDTVGVAATLVALCVLIVGLMLLPMISQTRGITSGSVWVVATHLLISVGIIPGVLARVA